MVKTIKSHEYGRMRKTVFHGLGCAGGSVMVLPMEIEPVQGGGFFSVSDYSSNLRAGPPLLLSGG